MKEFLLNEIRSRLTDLGYTLDVIDVAIKDAFDGAKKADAVYLNRRGIDRLFECAVIQCQFVDEVAHWFFQDSADKAPPETSK